MQQHSNHSCTSRRHNDEVYDRVRRHSTHLPLRLRGPENGVVDASSSAATLNMSNAARGTSRCHRGSFHHGSSSRTTAPSRRGAHSDGCCDDIKLLRRSGDASSAAAATIGSRSRRGSTSEYVTTPMMTAATAIANDRQGGGIGGAAERRTPLHSIRRPPPLLDPPGISSSSRRSAATSSNNNNNDRRGSISSSKRSIYTPTLRDAAAYSPDPASSSSAAADDTEDTSTASSSTASSEVALSPSSSSWDGRSRHYSARKLVSYHDTARLGRQLPTTSDNGQRRNSTTKQLINNNNNNSSNSRRQPCSDVISTRRERSGSVVAPKKKEVEEEEEESNSNNGVVTTRRDDSNNDVMKLLSVMTKKLLLPAMMLPVIFIRASTCNKKMMRTKNKDDDDDESNSDSDDDDSDADNDSHKGTVTTYCSDDDSSSSPSSSSSSSNDGGRLITSYYHYSSTTLDDDGERELIWCKKQRRDHRDIIKKDHGVVVIGKEKLMGENISSYYRDCVDDLVNENIRLYHKIVFLSQDREDILRQLRNQERGVNNNLQGRSRNVIQGSRSKSHPTEDSKKSHCNQCIVILDDNIIKIIEAENAAAAKLFSSSLHCIYETTDENNVIKEDKEIGNLELSAMGNEIMNLVSKICNFGVNVIPSNSSTDINSDNGNDSNKNDNKSDKKNDKIVIDKNSSSTPPESVECESKTSSSDGAPFSVTSITIVTDSAIVNDSARFTDVTTEVHCVDTSGRSLSTTTKSYCKRLGAIDGNDDDVDDHDNDASSDLEGVEDDSDKSHKRKAITAHYFTGYYDDERVGKENNDDVFSDKDFSVESVDSVDYQTIKSCYSRCSSYAPEKRAAVIAVETSEAKLSELNGVNTEDVKSFSLASGIGKDPQSSLNTTSFSSEQSSVVSINTPSTPSSSERTVSDDAFGTLTILIERLLQQRRSKMTIAEGGVSTSSSTANDNDDNLGVNVNSSTDNSSSSVEHVDSSLRSSTTTNTIGVSSITIDKSVIAANSAPSTLDDKQNITRGVHGIDTSGRSSITTMSSSKPSTGREVNLRRARDLLSGSDRTYTASTNKTSSSSDRQSSPVSSARGTNLRRASDLLRTSTVTHDISSSNVGQPSPVTSVQGTNLCKARDHLSPNVITSPSTLSKSPTSSNATPSGAKLSSVSSKSPSTSQSNSAASANTSSNLKILYSSNIALPFSTTTSDGNVQSAKSPPPCIINPLNWLPDEQYSFVNVPTTSTTTATTVAGQSTSSSISSSEGNSTREYTTITVTAITRSSKYLSFPSSCSHTYVTYFKASMSMVEVTAVLEEHLLLIRTRHESSSSAIDRRSTKVGKKKRYYIGEYDKEGSRHGYGLYTSKNGNMYLGEWYDDNREGLGIVKIENGDIFEGQFANNLKCGMGVYHYNDGECDLSFYTNDVRVGDSIRFTADRKKAYLISASNTSKSKLISLEKAAQIAEGMGTII